MARKIKIWNGRGHGKYLNGHIYVAAYSQKHAAELVSKACFGNDQPDIVSSYEIKKYYSPDCWGNSMEGIEATEPCVYASTKHSDKPERII